MSRTDTAAAVNQSMDPIATYHLDAPGLSRFRRLLGAISDSVNGRTGQHVYAPAGAFHGYAISPQRLTGAANLGHARVVANRSSTLDQEKEASPTNAVAMALFAERMRNGQG